MAELTNRDSIEADFAKKMAKLSARHRRELIELLGNPPRIENVPAEFWIKVKREMDDELAVIILFIFSTSMYQHGFSGEHADIMAEGWARQHAQEVSSQWVQTTRERLQKASDEWDTQAEEELPIPIQGRITTQPERVTDEQIQEETMKLFGPERIALLAENETTVARHDGSELAVDQTVGLSEDDIWNTADDQKVCPICMPLEKTPRSHWGRFFPDGPPSHLRCRCFLTYDSLEEVTA